MGYYMSFILTDSRPISLAAIESALKETDSAYAITEVRLEPHENGLLTHAGALYGEIDIQSAEPDDDEQFEELREDIEEYGAPRSKRRVVLERLKQAKSMVVVRVLWQGRGTEATLEKIDPLWEWLFSAHEGLLHAEGEGFYDDSGLLLSTSPD
jgi:hypothetical protein